MGGRGNQTISSVKLLDAVTAVTTGDRHTPPFHEERTFQAVGNTSSGAGAATVEIHASNVDVPTADGHWKTIGTITLTLGTAVTNDGFASDAAWRHVRAKVTAISGVGATVTVWMGV